MSEPWRRVAPVMGMPISVAVRVTPGGHAAPGLWAAAWEEVLAELREVDRVFSTYRPDSWVSRLARGEVQVGDCPPEVAEVLAIGERMRTETAGAFDVRHRVDGRTVLDPSGVVKGWAVQRAAARLAAVPDADYCLSAGGDLTCRASGDARPWRVGVEDPRDPTRLVATLPVRRGGVATSGSARRGAHVVDARTGRAPTGLASVTVVAADLLTADLDATAAFAMGPDGVDWLRARPGRVGVVVRTDGSAEVFGRDPASHAA